MAAAAAASLAFGNGQQQAEAYRSGERTQPKKQTFAHDEISKKSHEK